jgi:charged multivesicular body protein 1
MYNFMMNSMGAAMTLSTPQDQVDQLIQEVADESGLDVIDQLKDLNPTTSSCMKTSLMLPWFTIFVNFYFNS